MFGYEARPPLTSFNKRMDHYIIGKLLDEEKVDIFDVQKAVEENYPDFEDEEFDVTKAIDQGPWSNADLLAKQCKSIDSTLGSCKDKFYRSQKFWEFSWFISGMTTGNLLYPSEQFFEDLKIMNHLIVSQQT